MVEWVKGGVLEFNIKDLCVCFDSVMVVILNGVDVDLLWVFIKEICGVIIGGIIGDLIG